MTKRTAPKVRKPTRSDAIAPRSTGTKLFLGLLGFVGVSYLAIVVYHTTIPRPPEESRLSLGYMDECRELCLQYGLLPTGDVAADAKAFLVAARTQPLQNAAPKATVAGQSHPLLGKIAPEFELPDDEGKRWSLSELRHDGPVIVVFYYGYHCSHCVAQLFGLEDDLPKFTRHGVRIVALSADPPSDTAERFRQYGRFHFPVLSDHDYHVAERYGVYSPATAGREEDLKHGTFLVNQNGQIEWAYTGNQPFVDNKLLLKLVASKQEHAASGMEQGKAKLIKTTREE
jgi:thioredoxin-dependent peroxiredoxin